MGQEEMESLQTVVVVGIFIVALLALLFLFIFSKSQAKDVELKGTQAAISERIMASDCLFEANAKGIPERLVFKKDILDKSNNQKIPCLELEGSFYFVKVESEGHVWYFNNTQRNPYIYNAALRGVTRECTQKEGAKTISSIIKEEPDGFKYAIGKNTIERFGTVIDGERRYAAKITFVIDADSGEINALYPAGYPLCICDIPCPFEKCACVKGCYKKEAEFGESCGV